jgi:hypothetical protein
MSDVLKLQKLIVRQRMESDDDPFNAAISTTSAFCTEALNESWGFSS